MSKLSFVNGTNIRSLFTLKAPIVSPTTTYTVGSGSIENSPGFREGTFIKSNGGRGNGNGNYIVFYNVTGTSFEIDLQNSTLIAGIAGIQVAQLNYSNKPLPGLSGWNQDVVQEDSGNVIATQPTATVGFLDGGNPGNQNYFEARQGTSTLGGTIYTSIVKTSAAPTVPTAVGDWIVAPFPTVSPAPTTTQYRQVGAIGDTVDFATTAFFNPNFSAATMYAKLTVTSTGLPGTITSSGTAVTGNGATTFTGTGGNTPLAAGQVLIVGGQAQTIASVTDDNDLVLTAPFTNGDITTASAYSQGVIPGAAITQTITAVTPTAAMSVATTPVLVGDWIMAPFTATPLTANPQYRIATNIADTLHFATSAFFNPNLNNSSFAKLVVTAGVGNISSVGIYVTGDLNTTFTSTFVAGQVLIAGGQAQTIKSITDDHDLVLLVPFSFGDITTPVAYSKGVIPGAAISGETLTTVAPSTTVLGNGTNFSVTSDVVNNLFPDEFISTGVQPVRVVTAITQPTQITLDGPLNPPVLGAPIIRYRALSDGLPRAGSNGLHMFTSENDETTQYQLQAYGTPGATVNNALILKTVTEGVSVSGNLTLSSPLYLSTFRVLGATTNSTSNDAQGSVILNYTDLTSSSPMPLFVPNSTFQQGSSASPAMSAGLRYIAKSQGSLTTFSYSQTNGNLFETQLVNPNPAKQVASITFVSPTQEVIPGNGGGTGQNIQGDDNMKAGVNTGIFAVSGQFSSTLAITGVTPSAGPAAGGTSITISGVGFNASATVSIGGNSASVTSFTATSITCTTPAGTAGNLAAIQVNVTTPTVDSTIKTDGFYYLGSNPPGDTISIKYRSAPTTISVNGVGTVFENQLASTQTAGVIPRANWNDGFENSGNNGSTAPIYLVDNMGASTGASANWNFNNTASTNTNIAPTPGNGQMMSSFFPGTQVTFQLVGLPTTWSTVDVYVYVACTTTPANQIGSMNSCSIILQNRGVGVTCLPDVQYPRTETTNANGEPTINGFMRVPDNLDLVSWFQGKAHQGNYVLFPSVQVVNGRLNFGLSSGNTNNVGIAGIQIVALSPTLLSVNPSSCTVAGGVTVTLTGTNFKAGVRSLTFGGVQATNVTFVNSTTLTCTAPAHAAGVVDITLVDVNFRTATATGAFTYTNATAPTISSVTPNSGPDGQAITITGTGFQANSTVTIGGTNGFVALPATNVNTAGAPTSITCNVPAAIAGASSFLTTVAPFTSPSTGVSTALPGSTYAKASISPFLTGAISSVGTTVSGSISLSNYTGTAFTGLGGAGTVIYANGQFRTIASVTNDGLMTINTPFVPDLAYGQLYSKVTGNTPESGTISSSGTLVTGNGSAFTGNFIPGDVIISGGEYAVVASVSSSDGATRVTVANPTDTTQGILENGFTYTNLMPTITSVSPASAQFYATTAVTVTFSSALPGNFLSTGGTIAFGGQKAADIIVTSPTTLTCTVFALTAGTAIASSTSTTATVDGIVNFPDGTSTAPISADQFTYTLLRLSSRNAAHTGEPEPGNPCRRHVLSIL